ncbi:MAG: extracellular solute-binding protein [Acidobacterium ailaaui]|nr:extracellular solute-binding protein [Pseudacidobacterium ailaaui]
MVAVAQRYEELHPGIRIHWEKRTLDEFGHKPVDQLIHDFDLIVIDHPWAGFCFTQCLVFDLKKLLSQEQLKDLQQNCIGLSFESYLYGDKLLAIPIDTAAPVPSWRPDIFEREGFPLPETWDELVALSDKKQVVMPGFDADLFLNWMMLLYALDAHPFEHEDHFAEREGGMEAAFLLKRLAEPMPKEIIHWNPIFIAELMTQSDHIAYCPFAYSYNNYSRPSFVNNPLRYGNLIAMDGKPLRSILGGAGIAISSGCKEIEIAVDFSLYCASAAIQSGIYTYSGGQPVRKEAWEDDQLKQFTGGFFEDTYLTHQNALIRPRYNGFVNFQKKAGLLLQQFIMGEISGNKMWESLEKNYYESLV